MYKKRIDKRRKKKVRGFIMVFKAGKRRAASKITLFSKTRVIPIKRVETGSY
jgi:hypothetical protein